MSESHIMCLGLGLLYRMAELETEAKGQVVQIQGERDRLHTELENALGGLEEARKEVESSKAQLDSERSDLNVQLDKLTSELSDCKTKLREATQRAAELYDKNETLEAHVQELEVRFVATLCFCCKVTVSR